MFFHGLNMAMLTSVATMVMDISDLSPVMRGIHLMLSIILGFKLVSYSNVNRGLRAAWLLRWRVAKCVGREKTVSNLRTFLKEVEEYLSL